MEKLFWTGSLADLRTAVLLGANGWRVRDDRADANYRLGYYRDSIDDYTYSIKNNNDNKKLKARAFWWRGLAHKQLGNRTEYRSDVARAIGLDESFQKKLTAGDVCIRNHASSPVTLELDYYIDQSGEKQQFYLSYKTTWQPNEENYWYHENRPITASRFQVYVHANGNRKLLYWDYKQSLKGGATFYVDINNSDLP